MRTVIADIVRAIAPHDALEDAHRAETLAWIDSGAPLCRTARPATPPRHLVSYCVVVDPVAHQLLLADHRLSGLWLPSGGHVEPGEHPAATATREAWEELRLQASLLVPQPIFLTVTGTVGATAGHTDVSLWYVLRGDKRQEIQYDRAEFLRVGWFPLDALPLERADPHLHRFAAKLRRHLSAEGQEE